MQEKLGRLKVRSVDCEHPLLSSLLAEQFHVRECARKHRTWRRKTWVGRAVPLHEAQPYCAAYERNRRWLKDNERRLTDSLRPARSVDPFGSRNRLRAVTIRQFGWAKRIQSSWMSPSEKDSQYCRGMMLTSAT